jgi:polyisoprenyl-teichoic acid--peptidoglycan teichoic acid transferase
LNATGAHTDSELAPTSPPAESEDAPPAPKQRRGFFGRRPSRPGFLGRHSGRRHLALPGFLSRSPALAAALSYFVPGLGQLLVGRRRWALAFFVPFLAACGWLAWQLGQGLAWFGLSLFDGTFAATLIAVLAVLGAWRVLAVGHAFLVALGDGRLRRTSAVFVAVLLVSIVAMHSVAAASVWAVYETGVAMNDNPMLSDSYLAGPSPSASQTPEPFSSPTPPGSPTFAATPNLASPSPWATFTMNPNRITFLLIGADFMAGRSHSLTDTMILATLDVHTNKATVISVPRDTADFPLYYGPWAPITFKLNELMAASSSLGSPDSGVETLKKEVGYLVGLPIDYYAAIDLDGFVKMVDAVGGIDVNVTTAINDPFTGTFIAAGMNHFDGHTALKYVRSRESSSDYARSARQQDVLIALARKVVTPEVVLQLGTLLNLAGTTVATDFPMKYARNFVSAFRRVQNPYECVLGPPYSFHPDTSTTGGTWTSRLDLARVANLSVYLFGHESTYYGQAGVVPAPCGQ